MLGTIGFRPSVTPVCLQAALIVTVTGLIPSFNWTTQEESKISTSGGAAKVIFGKPRLVRRTGIVGVIVIT